MSNEYDFIYVDKPDDALWGVVGGGIHNYNTQQAGNTQSKQLCFVLYGPDHETAGGLIGETYWGWFYINLLFVKDELRGRGYGHRLLTLPKMKRGNVVQRMYIWIHSVFRRQTSISNMVIRFLAN
jgi:GNAT superfamily N-acetyltransferase